jgi:hypothetical protein
MMFAMNGALRWLLRFGALLGIVLVLIPALRQGWTHVETDFPNYYTAAVLARKHAPLRNFYDWTWFQRQMNYAGWEKQLGGYIPHSPLTMLPILPLTGLAPMHAKQVWLALNLVFLAAAIWILSSLTALPASGLLLLALAGQQALALNFIFGQYYIFILLLLALSFWLLLRGAHFWAGILLGVVFVLKLYAGPFLLYFAWKRQWRAFAGMAAACGVLAMVSIGFFGWRDNLYYLTDVLPRALGGESTDPYARGLATVSNLLRHAFVFEPELNPHPLANWPAVAFFVQPLVTLAAAVFCLISLPWGQGRSTERELAWFIVMLLLISPSRVQYMGVMLLVPTAFLCATAGKWLRVALVAIYLALTLPLPAAWSGFFPTVWILLAFYVALGIEYWRSLRPTIAVLVGLAIICAAAFSANQRLASYRREPPQRFERVADKLHAIYSASPSVSHQGIVFESIGDGRYELDQWSPSGRQTFAFEGQAFHPSVAISGAAIYFELVAGGHSRIMRYLTATKSLEAPVTTSFDETHPTLSPDEQELAFLAGDRIMIYSGGALQAINVPEPVHDVAWFPTGQRLVYSAGPLGSSQIYATASPIGAPIQLTHESGDHTQPAVSLDGQWLAETIGRNGTRQVWIQDLASGRSFPVTEGNCNSYSPAWELDSRSVVFASDCERGLGLPALYRWRMPMRFPQVPAQN